FRHRARRGCRQAFEVDRLCQANRVAPGRIEMSGYVPLGGVLLGNCRSCCGHGAYSFPEDERHRGFESTMKNGGEDAVENRAIRIRSRPCRGAPAYEIHRGISGVWPWCALHRARTARCAPSLPPATSVTAHLSRLLREVGDPVVD